MRNRHKRGEESGLKKEVRRCGWAELTEEGVSARGGWSEDGGVQLMVGRRDKNRRVSKI